MENNGALSGWASVDTFHATGVPAGFEIDPTGEYFVNGTFDSHTLSLGLTIPLDDGTLDVSASLTQTEKKPFDVVMTPAWDGENVKLDVQVPGKAHATRTADRGTVQLATVTTIELWWAKGKKLLAALPDKIPVF